MKFWMCTVAVLLAISFTGAAQAAKKAAGLKGKISAIDGAKITVTGGKKTAPTTTDITTDANTVVTRDGMAAKVADLKVGDYVMVTPDSGTATSITATTKKPEKKPKA